MLQQVIKELPEEEARYFMQIDKYLQLVFIINLRSFFRYHMKRCVDSGLWVPSSEDPGTSTEDGFVKAPVEDDVEEEVYDEVK